MSYIDLFLQGRRSARFHLKRTETRIGRSERCDVVLPADYVSRVHLLLRQAQNRLELLDRSRNGTFVNGTRTDRMVLKHGDRIDIGDWSVVVGDESQASDVTVQRSLCAAETVLGYESSDNTLRVLGTQLRFLDGPNKDCIMDLDKPCLILGAGPECDARVQGPGVESSHLELRSTDEGLCVMPLSNKSKTLLDNKVISGQAPLREGQTLQVGEVCLRVESHETRRQLTPQAQGGLGDMVGSSASMRTVFSVISRLADQEVPVLILGETGTGKELVARALHSKSRRCDGPFIALNCGALPEALVESELFGHVKGSFTGAVADKLGAFRAAEGGTLFLDEIGELDLQLQSRLLRVLESGEVRPVGSQTIYTPKVRVVTATHRDLAEEVIRGRFRADLFYRLFIVPVRLPPLRERREDIPELVHHFLRSFSIDEPLEISPEAMKSLQGQDWEGNVRALQNTILRAVATRTKPTIEAEDLEFPPSTFQSSGDLRWPTTAQVVDPAEARLSRVDRAQRRVIIEVLEETKGAKRRAAPLLGMARSTLYDRIEQFQIDVREFQGDD